MRSFSGCPAPIGKERLAFKRSTFVESTSTCVPGFYPLQLPLLTEKSSHGGRQVIEVTVLYE
jgi:hypothetical protein